MHTYSREEKDAYKAGARKAEREAAATVSVLRDSLNAVWALLGVDSQTTAVAEINLLHEYQNHVDATLRERQSIILAQADAIEELKSHIDALKHAADDRDASLIRADNYANALISGMDKERHAWSNEKEKLQKELAAFERECNRLSRELQASKAMGAYYLRQSKYPPGDFPMGSPVTKKEGYGYPGEVVAVFRNKIGQIRYVVEAIGVGYEGMLHIFNGDQLKRNEPRPMTAGESILAESILTAGFKQPEEIRHIQMVGRGLRPMPGAKGSEIIDRPRSTVDIELSKVGKAIDDFGKAVGEIINKLTA